MKHLIDFFVSGQAFIPGIAMIVAAVIVSLNKKKLFRALFIILSILGLCFIILSGVPVPPFLFMAMALSLCSLFLFLPLEARATMLFFHLARLVITLCVLYLFASEAASNKIGRLPEQNYSKVYIIGDGMSLSKGKTYADIMKEKYKIPVYNLSEDGNTTEKALKTAELISSRGIIVILELGYNEDFDDFSRNLKNLLNTLAKKKIAVIMFELPRISIRGNYIRIQRELAEQYNAVIIPRYVLSSAICRSEKSSGRLSPQAHEYIADKLATVVSGISPEKTGK